MYPGICMIKNHPVSFYLYMDHSKQLWWITVLFGIVLASRFLMVQPMLFFHPENQIHLPASFLSEPLPEFHIGFVTSKKQQVLFVLQYEVINHSPSSYSLIYSLNNPKCAFIIRISMNSGSIFPSNHVTISLYSSVPGFFRVSSTW